MEALHYEKLNGGKVHCHLCPVECVISDGKHGACGIRTNKLGTLYSDAYGKITSMALDPIEKKPLYHYHPGKQILSVGTKGCNLHCDFCQNWQISQDLSAPTQDVTSEYIIAQAKRCGSFGVAYTYNEPFIWYEFVLDTAKLAKKSGLENVLVTNGFVNMNPLEEILPYIDAMNIDLKAFNEDFYIKVCKGRLKNVLETIKRSARSCHVELTTLVIPGYNDSQEDMAREAEWISHNVGRDTPLHLSRYFPCYKMKSPPTPVETLERARDIALRSLRYVYLGNV